MKFTNTHINIRILVLMLLISPSCSTKKKSWVNRQYHNTTAKYNGYFNGKESIKAGVKKLHNSYVDDYTTIISVFPTGDLKKTKKTKSYMDKAIRKGSVVIQRHSMRIKGKEYCKWIDDNYLMIGQAYFYKGDFDEAIKTFMFVKNEYNKNQIRFDAAIWLVRAYVEKQDFVSAKSELEELINDKKTPKRLKTKLALVQSDFYLQKKDFFNAEIALNNATQIIKRKRKKARLHYILAQIYQNTNNYKLAQKNYEIVLKSGPDYEMAFNAKMNLARSLESGSPDIAKMKKKLFKMVKDDKNKEYLDQIYYTIAEMERNNNDTALAIESYKKSTFNSINNNSQKSLSFLALGELHFERKSYKLASANYDSCMLYMDDGFRRYNETKQRSEVLSRLVSNMNVIEVQDSLQMLAKLPRQEQQAIIKNIIQKLIDKEREEAENQRLKQQMIYESATNSRRGDQFGNNTSGGKWYFYNPATLSFGMSEFRKIWGKRKLEDDWRRKDKKSFSSFEADSTKTDTLSVEVQNKKSQSYYLNQLPKSNEEFDRSNQKIKEALYQLGIIYKESLAELSLSTSSFWDIYERFPKDNQYAPLALYNAYLNYVEIDNSKSSETKDILINNYTSSVYAKMIYDPNYKSNALSQQDLDELAYQQVFVLYNQGLFDEVIMKTSKISDNKNKNKLKLLRAFSFIKKKEIELAKKTLKQITNEDENAFQEAKDILEVINDPTKMNRANEMASSGSPYLFRPNNNHMIVVVLPKEAVDVTYLKTVISDFHKLSIENEVFEISTLLLGLEKHLLIIKPFDNNNESMEYYHLFLEEKKLLKILEKTEYKILAITSENFQNFYKSKDVDGYYKFFKKNYLAIN